MKELKKIHDLNTEIKKLEKKNPNYIFFKTNMRDIIEIYALSFLMALLFFSLADPVKEAENIYFIFFGLTSAFLNVYIFNLSFEYSNIKIKFKKLILNILIIITLLPLSLSPLLMKLIGIESPFVTPEYILLSNFIIPLIYAFDLFLSDKKAKKAEREIEKEKSKREDKKLKIKELIISDINKIIEVDKNEDKKNIEIRKEILSEFENNYKSKLSIKEIINSQRNLIINE